MMFSLSFVVGGGGVVQIQGGPNPLGHRCWVPKEVSVVKVGLSRFQKLIGELASVYHRQYARRLENS